MVSAGEFFGGADRAQGYREEASDSAPPSTVPVVPPAPLGQSASGASRGLNVPVIPPPSGHTAPVITPPPGIVAPAPAPVVAAPVITPPPGIVAPAPAPVVAAPVITPPAAIVSPPQVMGAETLRSMMTSRTPRPVPPPKRRFGNRRAQEEYQQKLREWEAEETRARIRERVRGRSHSVLVTNTKGGVGKTPTVLCLAAAMAELLEGGSVAAWEAAEERGTLLNRLSGAKGDGLVELLRNARQLVEKPSPVALDRYAAMLTGGARVFGSPAERDVFSGPDIETIHHLLSSTYELTIIDSANMLRSAAFRTAVSVADAVVVPTVISVDSATRMLETLELFEKGDTFGKVEHRPELLSRLVVVITDDGRENRPEAIEVLRNALNAMRVLYVEVPFDKHIAEGVAIEWSSLSPESRDAWRQVAMTVHECVHSAR